MKKYFVFLLVSMVCCNLSFASTINQTKITENAFRALTNNQTHSNLTRSELAVLAEVILKGLEAEKVNLSEAQRTEFKNLIANANFI